MYVFVHAQVVKTVHKILSMYLLNETKLFPNFNSIRNALNNLSYTTAEDALFL
jgi:hypothetical protein